MKTKYKTLLILSLFINLVAFGFALRRIQYQIEVQSDATASRTQKLRKYEDIYKLLPITNEDVVFIGDSHIRYFSTNELFTGINIKNRGVGGQGAIQICKRLDVVLAGHPEKIFIEVGINDMVARVDPDSLLKTFEKIINKCKERSPTTKLYIQTILPSITILKDSIQKFNNDLKLVCKRKSVTCIDINPPFARNGVIKIEYNSGDGIHLNGKGYQLWATILKPYL